MSSLDTTMGDGDTFVSNTDAIIYPVSDYSGWVGGDSMISDPNIVLSSTSTDDHYQHQISTGGGGGDLMSESSSSSSSVASSSWFKNNNNNNNNKQSEIRIFNVDFKALSEQVAVPSPSSFKALIQSDFLSELDTLIKLSTDFLSEEVEQVAVPSPSSEQVAVPSPSPSSELDTLFDTIIKLSNRFPF